MFFVRLQYIERISLLHSYVDHHLIVSRTYTPITQKRRSIVGRHSGCGRSISFAVPDWEVPSDSPRFFALPPRSGRGAAQGDLHLRPAMLPSSAGRTDFSLTPSLRAAVAIRAPFSK